MVPQPFRMLFTRGADYGTLYGYVNADIESIRQAFSMFADPLQAQIIPSHSWNAKTMPNEWKPGTMLGFETRVRPVHKHAIEDPEYPNVECDSLVHAVYHVEGGHDKYHGRENVYIQWIREQLERNGAVKLLEEATKLVSFQINRAYRALDTRHIDGPDATIRGTFSVMDSDAFNHVLKKGIGRHKSYGYGMVLLKPAQ